MMLKKLPNFGFSILPFVQKPYILLFNITQRCNLRCSYCFGKYYSETGQLSYKQIKKILAQFYSLGVRRLGISGGEPLLHPDIDKIIKLAVDLGFNIGINSNGILVPQHLDALKLVNNLSISLDGASKEIHDQYRGKGSFKKAIEGIEAAAKVGIPLHFCCTLTDKNLNEWPKILKLAEKYNTPVQMSPLYPRFRGDGGLKLTKSWEEKIKKTLKEIIQEKKKGNKYIFFSEDTYKLINKWPANDDISFLRERGHPKCLSGRKVITLDPQGNLFPCPRLTEVLPGQNCLKMGVKKAYENISLPKCKSCNWACFIEYNYLLNFHPSAIFNFLFSRFQ